MIKNLLLLLVFSFLAVMFHQEVRYLLIFLSSIPFFCVRHLQGFFSATPSGQMFGHFFSLLVSSAGVSALIAGGIWSIRRQFWKHFMKTWWVVWILYIVVLNLGPQAIAL